MICSGLVLDRIRETNICTPTKITFLREKQRIYSNKDITQVEQNTYTSPRNMSSNYSRLFKTRSSRYQILLVLFICSLLSFGIVMDTLLKVVALDDTLNLDSGAHYELEMDRERELSNTRRSGNEEQTLRIASVPHPNSIPAISSIISSSTSNSLTSSPVPQQSSTYTFCPRCIWRLKHPCAQRLQYIMRNRRDMSKSDAQSIVETEEGGACKPIRVVNLEKNKKSEGDAMTRRQQQHATIDLLRGQEGKWVQDWEYARRNAYIDHVQFHEWGITPDMPNYTVETALLLNSTSWKWVDTNSPVTEIALDGFCKVCYELDITRLFITIGDSLSRGFRKSLEALLGFTHPEIRRRDRFLNILPTENSRFHAIKVLTFLVSRLLFKKLMR